MRSSTSPTLNFAGMVLAWLMFVGIIVVLCLTGEGGLWNVPYITPTVKFIAWVLSPLTPFVSPLKLGIFIRIYRHRNFPTKLNWLFLAGSQVFADVIKVAIDCLALYVLEHNRGMIIAPDNSISFRDPRNHFCPLDKCTREWAQLGLFAGVIACEILGLKWDGGWITNFITRIQEEAAEKEAAQEETTELKVDYNDDKKIAV